MKHESVKELITQYLLGDLPPSVTDEIRSHLDGCADCRAEAQEMKLTLDLLCDALATAQDVPERLEAKHYTRIFRSHPVETSINQGIIIQFAGWFTEHHRQFAAAAAALFVMFFVTALLLPMMLKSSVSARRTEDILCRILPVDAEDQTIDTEPSATAEDAGRLLINGGVPPEIDHSYELTVSSISEKEYMSPSLPRTAAPAAMVQKHESPEQVGQVMREESAGAGKMVPLKLKLPRPGWVGTPKTIKSDNLETMEERQSGIVVQTKDYTVDSKKAEEKPESIENRRDQSSANFYYEKAKSPAEKSVSKGKYLPTKTAPTSDISPVSEQEPDATAADRFADNMGLRADKPKSPVGADRDMDADGPVSAGNRIARGGEDFRGKRETSSVADSRLNHDQVDSPDDTVLDGVTLGTTAATINGYKGIAASDRGLALAAKGFSANKPVIVAGRTSTGSGPIQEEKRKDIDGKERLTAERQAESLERLISTPNDINNLLKSEKDQIDANYSMEVKPEPAKAGLIIQDVTPEKKDEISRKLVETNEEDLSGPKFKAHGVNPFYSAAERPFSTFAIDVDTASYTLARNYMLKGFLPPAESVRTEEFVNFFDYAYKAPGKDTFKIYTDCAPSRFGRGLHMLKIGVKGRKLGREEEKNAVLTFVIDTSGSMNTADRIGLMKKSLLMLLDELSPLDRVAIIQFGNQARLVIEHTSMTEKQKIIDAINNLQCSGSTNLEEAMKMAYGIATREYAGGAVNRVLVMSDGAANIGSDAAEEILNTIEKNSTQGIYCSVFGFGIGIYNDDMLETLANKGDGTYTFIDSETEAERVFVGELSSTLNTIASDVKIQVEFCPETINQYRQLGFENRQLKKEQFRDDSVDAGEVGSGQSVTSLYELELKPVPVPYKTPATQSPLAIVRVRYRRVDTGAVEEIEKKVWLSDILPTYDQADKEFKLASSVAEFSEILRGSPYATGSDFGQVAKELRPIALEMSIDKRIGELMRMVQGAGGMSRGDFGSSK